MSQGLSRRHQAIWQVEIGLHAASLSSGQARRASLAEAVMPSAHPFEVATLHGIPLYDGDAEARDGIPAAVTALKQQIVDSDALLIATPEYNNSMPGVLKNGIDWLSRPPADIGRVFGKRQVAIVGASPGGFGTILSQNAWLPVLRTLGVQPWFGGRLMVARAGQVFNEHGEMVDEKAKSQLQQFVQGFVAALQR